MKRFLEWIGLKERLHESAHQPPLFKEGEIWWCSIGENIGNEINGKGDRFTRPIFILRKYDRYSFLGLPLTTKEKTGTWYCPVKFLGKKQTIVLMQGRSFDHRRLKEKMGELEINAVERVWQAYRMLH
jgi:mRNA interferase MazF